MVEMKEQSLNAVVEMVNRSMQEMPEMMARSIQNVVITKDQSEQFSPKMTDKEISAHPTLVDVGV